MKPSELMADKVPNKSYKGEVMADHYILAVDCTDKGDAASPDEYAVIGENTSGVDAQVNAETKDKAYVRSGKSTIVKSIGDCTIFLDCA